MAFSSDSSSGSGGRDVELPVAFSSHARFAGSLVIAGNRNVANHRHTRTQVMSMNDEQ